MAEVQMPQLGETVTEGTITKWFKQVGDRVEMDEVLFEVSTDKVDSEVPSPVAGYLTEIRAAEGDTVDVGAVIAVVGDEAPAGGAAAPPAAAPPEAPPAPAPSVPAAAPADQAPAPAPAPPTPPPVTAAAVPAPTPPATPAAPSAPAPAAPAPAGRAALVSPVVRRLIDEHGLDPAQVQGTGVGGRLTRADVERAVQSGTARAAAPAVPPPSPSIVTQRPAPRSGTGDTVVPLNNIRRRTGEHMVMSKDVSPHAMTAVEVDYENVERVRRAHRDAFRAGEGFSLTYLPFISRAVIDALHHFPHMNATVGEGELIVHNYVNLAIAVDLNFEGLLAPVIHGADDMRLRAIARAVDDLASRARGKHLSADDITGGTFTISNSGSFGTHMVIPIINQPQVAILSTDGIARKPVVVTDVDGNEAIAIHSVGLLALAWDHRAFDGAYAAAFMHEVKEILETRDWEAELA